MTEPHLDTTHPQYPEGFPPRVNDALLGHWKTPDGVVVVENHPHGYEVHFNPCYDFERCDACAPGRGPSNPHTSDGHHFRLCESRGPIVTVAGGEIGYAAVLEYLAREGSEPHVRELSERAAASEERDRIRRDRDREEDEAARAEEEANQPSPGERLAALEAELAALRAAISSGTP